MKMVSVNPRAPFVLSILIKLISALTIPLNHNPSNTTLFSFDPPSRLSFPSEPFRYQIIPYYDSQTSIIFTNPGPALSHDDAQRTLLEAQVIILREMAQAPQHGDLPVGRTRIFSHGSVTVTMEPRQQLNHAYLGLWLAGALEAGTEYGFVECEMRYVDERPMFGPGGFTLGRARLESSS